MARSFQARFREAFAPLGITPAQFARDTKMSRGNVSHWMNGRGRKPTAETAERAASRLGVNLAWLLWEEGQKPADRRPATKKGSNLAESASFVERRGSVNIAELTMDVIREAFDVVRAWLALPENERAKVKRSIETLALQYRATVPDPAPRKPPKRAKAKQ